MGFIESFEGDGDLADEKVTDSLYLSSTAPGDMVLRVQSVKIDTHHDEHKYPEEDFMVVEGIVEKAKSGQASKKGSDPRPVGEGDEVSLYFLMADNVKKSHKKALFRELIEILAAMSGDRESQVRDGVRDYLKAAAGGEYNGNVIRAKTKPPQESKGNTYHNYEYLSFDEDDLE